MPAALALVNGIPRMVTIAAAGAVFDETYTVPGGGVSAGTPISLPSSGAYYDMDLEVFLGGQFLEPGVDYNYVGSGTRTQITMVEDLLEGQLLRFRVEDSTVTIYDETTLIGPSGVTTGTSITLPGSGTYTGEDLEVYLNGEFMDRGIDWNDVGIGTKTQIQMTFDLVENDRLRFRKDHA